MDDKHEFEDEEFFIVGSNENSIKGREVTAPAILFEKASGNPVAELTKGGDGLWYITHCRPSGAPLSGPHVTRGAAFMVLWLQRRLLYQQILAGGMPRYPQGNGQD